MNSIIWYMRNIGLKYLMANKLQKLTIHFDRFFVLRLLFLSGGYEIICN